MNTLRRLAGLAALSISLLVPGLASAQSYCNHGPGMVQQPMMAPPPPMARPMVMARPMMAGAPVLVRQVFRGLSSIVRPVLGGERPVYGGERPGMYPMGHPIYGGLRQGVPPVGRVEFPVWRGQR